MSHNLPHCYHTYAFLPYFSSSSNPKSQTGQSVLLLRYHEYTFPSPIPVNFMFCFVGFFSPFLLFYGYMARKCLNLTVRRKHLTDSTFVSLINEYACVNNRPLKMLHFQTGQTHSLKEIFMYSRVILAIRVTKYSPQPCNSNLTHAALQTLMGLPAQGKLAEPHHMHSDVYCIFGIKWCRTDSPAFHLKAFPLSSEIYVTRKLTFWCQRSVRICDHSSNRIACTYRNN